MDIYKEKQDIIQQIILLEDESVLRAIKKLLGINDSEETNSSKIIKEPPQMIHNFIGEDGLEYSVILDMNEEEISNMNEEDVTDDYNRYLKLMKDINDGIISDDLLNTNPNNKGLTSSDLELILRFSK